MKVKIGYTIYSPEDQPIMLILSSEDKKNIANMHPSCNKFCSAPDSISREEIVSFMNIGENDKELRQELYDFVDKEIE